MKPLNAILLTVIFLVVISMIFFQVNATRMTKMMDDRANSPLNF